MKKFFFPNEGKTIEAETLKEAINILNSNTNTENVEYKKPVSIKKKGI